ncbi:MAG: aminotransferase class III-fold pyridoxal phosphate-dependent enzyme [Actinomycetota bacterium]
MGGGCAAPPDAFWSGLAEVRQEHDLLLCLDEVKTGFGRPVTCSPRSRGLEPDLIALGKAMGGGVMPIGAVLGTERAMGSTTSRRARPGRGCRRRAWRRSRRSVSSARSRCWRTSGRPRPPRCARARADARSAPACRRRARDRMLHRDRVRARPHDEGAGP